MCTPHAEFVIGATAMGVSEPRANDQQGDSDDGWQHVSAASSDAGGALRFQRSVCSRGEAPAAAAAPSCSGTRWTAAVVAPPGDSCDGSGSEVDMEEEDDDDDDGCRSDADSG